MLMPAKKGPVTTAAEAVKDAAKTVVKAAEKKVVKPAAKALGLAKGKKATPKKK
jgi:hypothetical protein